MSKQILLGIGGGIAAYKSAALCSLLTKHGYEVQVLMTAHAAEFIQPLTFQSLSKKPVVMDTFMEPNPGEIAHIAMADRADLYLIAPATANLVGKLANGIADDMVTTTALAVTAPVLLAPAMNVHMYEHPAVQANLITLRSRGVTIVEPGSGPLACGYTGKGRLAEPDDIVSVVNAMLTGKKDLAGLQILVTAGPTVEDLDPVRFLTNASSGKMGFAIAEAAVARGAEVVLVSGPTSLIPPAGVKLENVRSTEDMKRKVLDHLQTVDVLISAAAPVDFRPSETMSRKWKKSDGLPEIEWVQTPDILGSVSENKRPEQIVVGFAAETNDVVENARKKIGKKRLAFVVANHIGEKGAGFGVDTNRVTLVFSDHDEPLPLMPKTAVADEILNRVVRIREEREV